MAEESLVMNRPDAITTAATSAESTGTAEDFAVAEVQPATFSRPTLALGLKILVTVGLLFLLARQTDWSNVQARLALADVGWLLAGIGLLGLSVPLIAVRWHSIAKCAGAPMPLRFTLRLSYAGLFLGQFLPAGVGVDAVRGWYAYRSGLRLRAVVTGLLVDRMAGLLALVVFVVAGTPILARLVPADVAMVVPVAATVLVAGMVVGLQIDRLPWPAMFRTGTIGKFLMVIMRRMILSGQVLPGLLLALVLHLTIVTAVTLLAHGLGIDAGLTDCFAIVPATVLLSTLPFSLNGWGVREGAMVVGFGFLGVDHESALVLSVLIGLGMVMATLPGAAIWLSLRDGTGAAEAAS